MKQYKLDKYSFISLFMYIYTLSLDVINNGNNIFHTPLPVYYTKYIHHLIVYFLFFRMHIICTNHPELATKYDDELTTIYEILFENFGFF